MVFFEILFIDIFYSVEEIGGVLRWKIWIVVLGLSGISSYRNVCINGKIYR